MSSFSTSLFSLSLRAKVQRSAAAAILVGGLASAGPAMAQSAQYVDVPPPRVGAVDSVSGNRPLGGVLSESGTRPVGAVLSESGNRPVGAVEAVSDSRSASIVAGQAQVTPRANASGLAFTGADIAGLTMLGGLSIGIGVLAVRSSRRRSAEADPSGPLAAG